MHARNAAAVVGGGTTNPVARDVKRECVCSSIAHTFKSKGMPNEWPAIGAPDAPMHPLFLGQHTLQALWYRDMYKDVPLGSVQRTYTVSGGRNMSILALLIAITYQE